MKTTNSSQTRLLYNPQLQSAEMTEKLFVVRKEQFALLLNDILKEKENSIPQHHLIIGQRGMGKTTILKRMEVELHKEQYRKQFIPLIYREEQYNIKDLAEFWLNTLDALADSLQYENYPPEMLADIDKTIRELSRKEAEIVSKEAYRFLMDTCRELHRRPVLLIDNIDIVFSGLDSVNKNKQEQWALRKLLSENGAPIVIGGGITTTNDVVKYDMPFYNYFKIQYLYKLNYDEFVKLLNNLATATDSDASVFASIQQNTSRQKALLELTGGSPRVTAILFDQISKGFSTDINDDLNILADAITPLYKAKFEELPPQQRTILDAIALNWDAISLRKLAIATRMKNTQLSPQLKRLIDSGWIETTPAYKDKGNAYFISERFFNIYYLIRNSSRRHKDKIYCLSKFLECFYGKEELERIAKNHLCQDYQSEKDLFYAMVFKKSKMLNKKMRNEFENKIISMKNKNILDDYFKSEIIKISNKKIQTAFKQGKYDTAVEMLTNIIDLNSNNADNYGDRGRAYVQLNKLDNAVDDFTQAIKLEPENAHWYYFRGSSFLRLQAEELAVADCSKVIDLNQHDLLNYGAYSLRGGIHLYQNKFELAIADYDKSISITSVEYKNRASDYSFRGMAKEGLLDYLGAIEDHDKSIELNPEDETAWFFKAECLLELKQYEEAIKSYDKATELNPNYHVAWNNKGYTYMEMKSFDKSAVAYEKARVINPKDLIPKLHLMFLYRDKLGKMDNALEIFKSIKEEDVNQNEEKELVCRFYLHKTLFDLYEQNKGIAKENLLRAVEVLEDEQKIWFIANEYWGARFASVVIKLGYGSWLLKILEEKGYDVVLSPYYTAIQALEIEKQDRKNGKEGAEVYLNNRAVEISEPAKEIVEKIRKYMD